VPVLHVRRPQANLPEAESTLPVIGMAEASLTEEPGAEAPHTWIWVRGAAGNRPSYCDGGINMRD
jgi:hypothetical protein